MKSSHKSKSTPSVLKIVYGGVLIALGILLPQAFHVFGQEAGMIFLPIQIPILFAGLLLGPLYGGLVGILVPILSFLLTGMPPLPKMYFMLFELGAYGITAGLLIKKCNVYFTLLLSMICGRVAYGFALILGVYLIGLNAPFANMAAFTGGIVSGIPGIIIQLIVLPILYITLKKGGFTFDTK